LGRSVGLVGDDDYGQYLERRKKLLKGIDIVRNLNLGDVKLDDQFLLEKDNRGTKLAAVLKRSDVSIFHLAEKIDELKDYKPSVLRRIEIEIKYEGYIKREESRVMAAKSLDVISIPQDFDYKSIVGLSNEVLEKLSRFEPENLGQASRISGVTPAAVQILRIFLQKKSNLSKAGRASTPS